MSSGTGIYMCADPDVFYTSVSLTEERFMKNTGTSVSRLSTADVKLEILASSCTITEVKYLKLSQFSDG